MSFKEFLNEQTTYEYQGYIFPIGTNNPSGRNRHVIGDDIVDLRSDIKKAKCWCNKLTLFITTGATRSSNSNVKHTEMDPAEINPDGYYLYEIYRSNDVIGGPFKTEKEAIAYAHENDISATVSLIKRHNRKDIKNI